LTNIDSPSLELRQVIAKEMYTACHDVGFFYVVNHGIPQSVIDDTFKLLKRFFALERDVKMDAHVQKNPAIRGYEPMGETKLDPRTRGGKSSYVDQSLSPLSN
jgi:isopenicillin N synthase-like dioxygenase